MNADQLSDVTHINGSLWSLANKKYNPNFTALKGKTDITIDLRELIANNEEKLDVYDDAYEVAML